MVDDTEEEKELVRQRTLCSAGVTRHGQEACSLLTCVLCGHAVERRRVEKDAEHEEYVEREEGRGLFL